ncbi:hypothetical protein RUM43_008525 [Polyplax serrata]|uniref:SBF1/SBF2 domain-containing protein n=1 Tax=Polyplax serrata TaxID=468196 RepID=A0AAN8S1D4_POLSC
MVKYEKMRIANVKQSKTLQDNNLLLVNSHGTKSKDTDACTPILQLSITFHPDEYQLALATKRENDIKNFMISYVGKLFSNADDLTLEQKAQFGEYVRLEEGQTWFARIVNSQRADSKCVSETTFYRLVQHFAIVLFECANSDHFSPAKTLMNMCLTFYHEVEVPGCEPFQEYLSTYLRNQPIWQNIRFWNAAFFDALQCVRVQKPVLTKQELLKGDVDVIMDEEKYQENITFGQLGTFICTMHAFGLDKKFCKEFLKKQFSIASLPNSQEKMLVDHMHKLYEQTELFK